MNRSGFTMGFAFIIAMVLAVLLLTLANIGRMAANQNNYIMQMDRTLRLAESGMNATVALISKEPEAYDVDVSAGGRNNAWTEVSTETGSYKTSVSRRNIPIPGAVLPGVYYIVNLASRTVAGRVYRIETHTYARISNAGEYFAAINDTVNISHPTDLSNARIYGLNLKFVRQNTYTYANGNVTVQGSGSGWTTVKEANFVNDCWPPVDCSISPCSWVGGYGNPGSEIQVLDGGANQVPVKLSAPIMLPQILPSDIAYYITAAGVHTTKSVFTSDIFPPGYNTTKDALDTYAGHTSNNPDHVYYFKGNIDVQGTVHGQVLLVASGDIRITGNIISAPALEVPPGVGASSSTAHQLVLIPGPGHNVYIQDSVYTGGTPTTVQLEALVLCPNGTIFPNNITSAHAANLKLAFKGSMILGQSPDFGDYFHYDDGAGTPARTYAYMDTLRTSPPPYLPAVTEVYHSVSKIISTDGMY